MFTLAGLTRKFSVSYRLYKLHLLGDARAKRRDEGSRHHIRDVSGIPLSLGVYGRGRHC